ncbi:MAG: ECF transporter S component [Christensenellaceae bacterium]|jgi:riboflavin transporter FmnP|nr:ECF transporter S component [Christensenellaceae bacterium]
MKKISARAITLTAVMGAVAFILQFFEITIPIIPAFIKLDFSDLPALIAAFALGPVSGTIVCAIKNLLHLTTSSSAGVGEIANFVFAAAFVIPAGLLYRRSHSKKGALIASLAGAAAMAIVCVPVNYFVVYPLYYSVLGFPEVAVLGMYQAILPSIKGIFEALLVFNLPFTFVKGLLVAAIAMLIYKPLSPLLHGRRGKA